MGDATLTAGTLTQAPLTSGTLVQQPLVSGAADPGTLTLGTSDPNTPVFGAPVGTPSVLNCTDATCGTLVADPTTTAAPFCGDGSNQWIQGLDNCTLLYGVGGLLAVLILLPMLKGRR